MKSTPLSEHAGILLKREDLFERHGVRGGKVRQAMALLAASRGARGLTGAGGRRSNTAAALAAAGREFGIPVRFHTADGTWTAEMAHAEKLGATIVRHRPGYLTVCEARAREDAANLGWLNGLKYQACVDATAAEMVDTVEEMRKAVTWHLLPFSRVVVTVGAGVHLAGICKALHQLDLGTPILAVTIGAEPDETFLNFYAPRWRNRITFVASAHHYDKEVTVQLGDFALDKLYEAKAWEFTKPGDLFFVSGVRGDYAQRD